jgi:hypothetical protein
MKHPRFPEPQKTAATVHLPRRRRLSCLAVLLVPLLGLALAGCEQTPTQHKAAPKAASAAPEAKGFTGAVIEWPDSPIDGYVTQYVVDNEVRVSLRNLSRDKPVHVGEIRVLFEDGKGEALDEGTFPVDRVLAPGEKTGLITLVTENKSQHTRDYLNENTRRLDFEVTVKETLKQSVDL